MFQISDLNGKTIGNYNVGFHFYICKSKIFGFFINIISIQILNNLYVTPPGIYH